LAQDCIPLDLDSPLKVRDQGVNQPVHRRISIDMLFVILVVLWHGCSAGMLMNIRHGQGSHGRHSSKIHVNDESQRKPLSRDENPCYNLALKPPNPNSWHVHVLFDSENAEAPNGTNVATAFAKRASDFKSFQGLGGTRDSEYVNMCKKIYTFNPSNKEIGSVVKWLSQHLGNLSAFVHPRTGCSKTDHVKWGWFMGTVYHSNSMLAKTSRWSTCDFPGSGC